MLMIITSYIIMTMDSCDNIMLFKLHATNIYVCMVLLTLYMHLFMYLCIDL